MDHSPIRQTFKFENNFSTVRKSFLNLVKLRSLVVKYCKMSKYTSSILSLAKHTFVQNGLSYITQHKTIKYSKLQQHTHVLQQWAKGLAHPNLAIYKKCYLTIGSQECRLFGYVTTCCSFRQI